MMVITYILAHFVDNIQQPRFAHLKPNKVDATYYKSIVGVLENGSF
jgi:hypothetical protein